MTTTLQIPRGAYTALVTPFINTVDGYAQSVDEHGINQHAFKRQVQRQLEAGIDGLVILGTTGESPTVDVDERRVLFHTAAEQRDLYQERSGRFVPLYLGTGSNSTRHTQYDTRHAEILGADGVLVVSPYYNKPTQEGLFQHFRAVAHSTSLPVMVYNIPGRTGVNIETETMLRIVNACDNVVAVKEASGNRDQIKDVIKKLKEARPEISIMSGDDALTPFVMRQGGDGVISVVSNVVPADVVKQILLHTLLQPELTLEITQKLDPLIKACFIETNPGPIKYMMNRLGFDCGPLRLPLVMPTELSQRQIDRVLHPYGLLKKPLL